VPFENRTAQECPVDQRKLLIASGLFTEALSEIAHPAAAIARVATAENVLYVIWLRLLQMSRSIQASCYMGYAHEQQGLVRSMVNAASDLIYIARQEKPANWAMLYAAHAIERRKKIGRGYIKVGLWTRQSFDKWDSGQDAKEREALEEAKRKCIVPAEKHNLKSKNPPQTWSGLADADIVNRTGRPWYPAYYVPFSDLAHANVMTAAEEFRQLKAGEVTIGPRFPAGPLAYVILGMGETMNAGVETINNHFHLGKGAEIGEHERAMRSALVEYRDTLPQSPVEALDA
jgi:hypothetical protein